VARPTHANFCSDAADHVEKVGKPALEQSGKYRVNKNDEESFQSCPNEFVALARAFNDESWIAS